MLGKYSHHWKHRDRFMPLLRPSAQKSRIFENIPFQQFALVTAHRAENLVEPAFLADLVNLLLRCPLPVVYPMHPRTLEKLRTTGLELKLKGSENVMILPPLGYLDFPVILMNCEFIITDSGGIQEEATAPNVRKKVFVIQRQSER